MKHGALAFAIFTPAPYYTASLQDQALLDSDDEAQTEASTQLYKRIQALTDQVHSELDTMIDLDTISSYQSTPGPIDEEQVPLHELNPHSDSGIFTAERSSSAMNVGDLVPALNEEDDVVRDCDTTLTASSDPSITSVDPKIKKAIEKMKRLDEKLADLEKVRALWMYLIVYMYLNNKYVDWLYSLVH